ncbi:oxidoreductase [Gorillibacterium massiliense]|uniref:oxidoreductase n=1 Tax=Gorillibacterium massiliense TaxID=1280390 RepID=UPI0004BAF3AF|nr:oxidoreductase [Gorillibacterium massiliense]
MTMFRALTVDRDGDVFTREIREWTFNDLPEGELLIKVSHSGLNYKDGLAGRPDGKIVNKYPFIPGIDLAGTVVSSQADGFREGDAVLVTGYGLGVSHFGGLSQYARVPAAWAVPLPAGLTPVEAMAYGTAGLTAALCVARLEAAGLTPERGPVLVTGAGGGVGSLAVALLARRGYTVAAGTGKAAARDWLRQLGAAEILGRGDYAPQGTPPALARQRWAGVVDPVGGATLAHALAATQYGGAVAACGMAGGMELPATVYPFILRGVSLLGVDSVFCPHPERISIWNKLAGDWKPDNLQLIYQEISLEEVPQAMDSILAGNVQGRLVVKI